MRVSQKMTNRRVTMTNQVHVETSDAQMEADTTKTLEVGLPQLAPAIRNLKHRISGLETSNSALIQRIRQIEDENECLLSEVKEKDEEISQLVDERSIFEENLKNMKDSSNEVLSLKKRNQELEKSLLRLNLIIEFLYVSSREDT